MYLEDVCARADWGGLIKETFDWSGDFREIQPAGRQLLGCTQPH
jgi:hypothetical protein